VSTKKEEIIGPGNQHGGEKRETERACLRTRQKEGKWQRAVLKFIWCGGWRNETLKKSREPDRSSPQQNRGRGKKPTHKGNSVWGRGKIFTHVCTRQDSRYTHQKKSANIRVCNLSKEKG